MKKWSKIALAGLLIVILSGCNLPSRVNPDEGSVALTMAVQTVEAQSTLNAQTETAPQQSPGDGQPTITLAPSVTPQSTAATEAEKCDAAGFIKDVTIPDGTEMMPGESFTKTWRLINEGTCEWNSGYDLVFDDGVAMDAPASRPVTKGTVEPGAQVDVSIDLVAPDAPGTYRGLWQLRNDADVIFTTGGFWAEITVVEPEVWSSKISFKVGQTFEGDLDDGSSPPGGTADFWFRVVAANDKRLSPLNIAEFAVFGEDEPAYGECADADLKDDDLQIDADLVGYWVCYFTSEGRIGKFEVVSLKPNDISQIQTLELDYLTWKLP